MRRPLVALALVASSSFALGCGDDEADPVAALASELEVVTFAAEPLGNGGLLMNATTTGAGDPYWLWFEWGTSPTLATLQSTDSVRNEDYDCTSVETCAWYYLLVGLYGGTTHYFRIAATSGADTKRGDILAYQTPPPVAPFVRADSASRVTATGVRLNAVIDPNGADVTVQAEVSRNADMSDADVGTPVTKTPWDAWGEWYWTRDDLQPGTRYYWRVVASNSAGTSSSLVGSFTTLAALSTTGGTSRDAAASAIGRREGRSPAPRRGFARTFQ